MSKEIELWTFVAERLHRGERVMLLVVASSQGSSPGRAGYKMAVGADGQLLGSIGGGVMEVNLVEAARAILDQPAEPIQKTEIIEQQHRRDAEHPSGMICSGRQTVIRYELDRTDLETVDAVVRCLELGDEPWFTLTDSHLAVASERNTSPPAGGPQFEIKGQEFRFADKLGPKNELVIIGGGHCALALSEVMSRLDFRIRIYDDRPELNTIAKNRFAKSVVLTNYDLVGNYVTQRENVYVVVMTLGYASDEVVIRSLLGHQLKYFGVLGSKAKMAALLRALRHDGVDPAKLVRIRTPIGVQINSHSPEEIAISIAAEIIGVKNAE